MQKNSTNEANNIGDYQAVIDLCTWTYVVINVDIKGTSLSNMM